MDTEITSEIEPGVLISTKRLTKQSIWSSSPSRDVVYQVFGV